MENEIFISLNVENNFNEDKEVIEKTFRKLFRDDFSLLDTNYRYELIYRISYPESSNEDDYVIFWNKVESLLFALSRFLPHFTTYDM